MSSTELFPLGRALRVLLVWPRFAPSKNSLAQKNPFAVMAKRPMADGSNVCLALAEPIMDGQVVIRRATEEARRSDCVVIGVSHWMRYLAISMSLTTGTALGSSVIMHVSRSTVKAPYIE
jgi:hypothetical protein